AKGEGLSGKGEGLGGKGEEDAEQRTEDGGQRTEDGMGGAKGEGLSGKGEGLSGKGKGLRDVAGGQVKEREEVPAREKPVGGDPVGRAQPVLVLLLPGSRRREVRMHLPAMLEAAEIISRQALVRLRLVLPNEALVELARPWAINMPGLEIRAGGLADSLAESGLAIAASGTVTMECAFFRVPTVVIYRTSWSTYELGKRIIRVKYLAMPNLLANESVYPELIQHGAVAEAIASRATDLLHDPLLRAAVQAKLSKVIASLGPPGASQRAAQAVLDHLGTKRGFLRIPLTFSNQPST
ncbi:MAG: hypothetical protein M1608_01075, partial [Candidatus Omnitrophica bacterium]|nr:hypothetical protein [Candidatus Omnitrophota bacterium]